MREFEPGNASPPRAWDDFLVGEENLAAQRVAAAFAARDEGVASPLLILGETGTGKTRVLRELSHDWRSRQGNRPGLMLGGDAFLNECLLAQSRDGGWGALRERMRSLPLLIIDDLDLVAHPALAYQELAHTLEAIHGAGGALAFAARRPPSRWADRPQAGLARLASMVLGGVTVVLEAPRVELRRRFTFLQLKQKNLALAAQTIDWLAESADGFRTLEGWITQLATWARMDTRHRAGDPIEHAKAQALLAEGAELAALPTPDLEAIAHATAMRFKVSVRDLRGASRRRGLVEPRHLAMYLAREHTATSFAEIGAWFGSRDEKAARHAWKLTAARIASDPSWSATAVQVISAARPRAKPTADSKTL